MTNPPPSTTFTPIAPNPFIVGNPVRGRSMFFGREAEFAMVRNRFLPMERGGLLVFCGERRSGKTSILFQIMDRRLGPDFIPVLIDMQSMAVDNEREFLGKLSDEILAALGSGAEKIASPTFPEGANHSATFRDFVWDVLHAQPGKKLILLFDEYELFESKIDSGAMSEDVLHVLSSLMEHAPVFLVFTGSLHLEQRRRQYWTILLGRSMHKRISYLDREDSLSLIQQPVEGRVHYAPGSVETIHRLTAGHPFYTQAICQHLVDHLNDHKTSEATNEAVHSVVKRLIDNPLPQMLFLWEGLEHDEKFVLALLAGLLESDTATATVPEVVLAIRRAQYPLDLGRARIATALETLFRGELLLRDDAKLHPGYSFRMDLWRQWIRRQHTMWQVMKELGIEIRPNPLRRWIPAITASAGVGVAALIWLVVVPAMIPVASKHTPPATTPSARVALEAVPDDSRIYMDGQAVGIGAFQGAVSANREYVFKIAVPGYSDTIFARTFAAGDSESLRVRMRPRTGNLRIDTQPTGAVVRIDGQVRGTSPLTIIGLPVPIAHTIEATLPGYGIAQRTLSLTTGQTTSVSLPLLAGRIDVAIETVPVGASIRLDGSLRGNTPTALPQLELGRSYRLIASREGYAPIDTLILVSERTRHVSLVLQLEPFGVLEIQGDVPARIFLEDVLIGPNVQHSRRELPRGSYIVHVALANGAIIDSSIFVRSGELAIFDYSERTIRRKPLESLRP